MNYREMVAGLRKAGIDNPERDAALFAEKYFGVPEYALLADPGREYDSPGFRSAFERRIGREPLQYIFGSWFFYGLEFALNTHTLCPRPDTELLCEKAIGIIPYGSVFADAGTGSGCIAGAILRNRPDLRARLFDIDEEALACAGGNMRSLGVSGRAELRIGDMLSDRFCDELRNIDVLVSNPPYIPGRDIPLLEPELSHEPYIALYGGEDGLDFYRALTSAADKAGIGMILYEIGIGESEAVKKIAGRYGYSCDEFADLSGIVRTILLNRQKR